MTPSLERLRTLIAACGLELTFGLARADDSYDPQVAAALGLQPAQRLVRALRDAEPMRAARALAADEAPSRPVDVVGVLRALNGGGVRYILVGEVAEALHGSPLLTIGKAVTIVPRAYRARRFAPRSPRRAARSTPARPTQRRTGKCGEHRTPRHRARRSADSGRDARLRRSAP